MYFLNFAHAFSLLSNPSLVLQYLINHSFVHSLTIASVLCTLLEDRGHITEQISSFLGVCTQTQINIFSDGDEMSQEKRPQKTPINDELRTESSI